MRLRGAGCLLIVAAAGAGCEGAPTGPARDASPVQTDATVYLLAREPNAWRGLVLATYRNDGADTVYFPRCDPRDDGPIFGVRRTGADSTRPYFTDLAWACVGGVPLGAIPPSASVTVTVPLGSSDQPHMQPPLQLDWLVGTLRVVLQLCSGATGGSDGCAPLPQSRSQSNAFEVWFRGIGR